MQQNIATELTQFIKNSPSAFHAVDTMKKEFLANGFSALYENELWNLQAGGSHLVWFSVPWSLELYQQTNARLYRQGQKAGTVVVQHLVAKGTVDESILKALRAKDMTQAALIEAVKAQIKEAGA